MNCLRNHKILLVVDNMSAFVYSCPDVLLKRNRHNLSKERG